MPYTYKKQLLKEEYPLNLLLTLKATTVLEISLPTEITEDILDGVAYGISTLNTREQTLIHLRYVERFTYANIAKHFGISQQRVIQLEFGALKKLRNPSVRGYLRYGLNAYRQQLTISHIE